MPSLGFGGRTVGLGPIFRAGSTTNRPAGLLLVAETTDGAAAGFTAAGTAADSIALGVDNTGTANGGEEERCWTGALFSGAGTLG